MVDVSQRAKRRTATADFNTPFTHSHTSKTNMGYLSYKNNTPAIFSAVQDTLLFGTKSYTKYLRDSIVTHPNISSKPHLMFFGSKVELERIFIEGVSPLL